MLRRVSGGYVYIMAGGRNGTLYIGVTSDLVKRAFEHRRSLERLRLVWAPAFAGARAVELELPYAGWRSAAAVPS